MERKPHILHLLPYLETGGTEKHVLTLLATLRQLGLCSGEVLAPPGPFAAELERHEVKLTSFTPSTQGVVAYMRSFRQAFRLAAANADIVHVHGAPDLLLLAALTHHGRSKGRRRTGDGNRAGDGVGAQSGRGAGSSATKARLGVQARVLTVHGFHGQGAAISYRFAALLSNRLAQATICVAGSEERLLLAAGLQPRKLHRIYNGVADPLLAMQTGSSTAGHMGASTSKSVDHVRIAFIGRLSPVKGVDVLLRALALLVSLQQIDIKLDIMGVGEEAEALQALAHELHVADRVEFLGYCADAVARLAQCDIFCLPSREDMGPLVCVEAMAQGKPVVSTWVGGIPEMVEDGVTGLLVPSDDVTALAQALEQLAVDHGLREKMGAAGRRRYEAHYTQESMARNTFAVYQSILEGEGPL